MTTDKNEWLQFFSSIHTSKGIYKQPKFAIHDFLETGEREPAVNPPAQKPPEAKPVIKPAPVASDSSTLMVSESTLLSSESTVIQSKINETKSDQETSMETEIENETIMDESDETVCDKGEDPEFISKLTESIGFLKQGLPLGTTLRVSILYAINLIKPADGKEELWFEAIKYDETNKQFHLKLITIPEKVKYLKAGSIIKPTLEKIEKFQFAEEA